MAGPLKAGKAPSRLSAGVSRILLLALGCTAIALALVLHNAYVATSLHARNCRSPWMTAWAEGKKLKLAMVTLSDAGATPSGSGRDFQSVLQLTRENKQAYADVHGYKYIDASNLLDASRPASWSKILAVQHHLSTYDWVLWLDADTLVTNPQATLEAILPGQADGPDLVITQDGGGFNAGMWFLRNSEWSAHFLTAWWAMEDFVRRQPGDTKSGDNDALKHLLANMPRPELARHVGVVPQCAFNSYLWKPSMMNWIRYLRHPASVSAGLHHQGDFMLHLAGWDDKVSYVQTWLEKNQAGSQAST